MKPCLTNRDFCGEETWKAWKRDYDNIMAWRKTIKGIPDQYDRALIELYRPLIAFYKAVL